MLPDASGTVIGVAGLPQREFCEICLWEFLNATDESGCVTDADEKHSCGHWIERSSVASFEGADKFLDAVDQITGGAAGGLVQIQESEQSVSGRHVCSVDSEVAFDGVGLVRHQILFVPAVRILFPFIIAASFVTDEIPFPIVLVGLAVPVIGAWREHSGQSPRSRFRVLDHTAAGTQQHGARQKDARSQGRLTQMGWHTEFFRGRLNSGAVLFDNGSNGTSGTGLGQLPEVYQRQQNCGDENMVQLDILVVAPHPDDAEISVGGTIAASLRQNLRVGILDLTDGEPTPRGTVERRALETAAATEILGLSWRGNLGLPNRSLQPTLEARRALAEVIRRTRPGVILAPWKEDAHPDHVAASTLVDDARFWAKLSRSDMAFEPWWTPLLLHYFSIHLRIQPPASVVMDVSDVIEVKMAAVAAYASQLSEGRSQQFPTVLDDIRDRARYWGWAIGRGFGEPLLNRESVGISSLRSVIAPRG